ncbi:LCP family protein [Clostridium aestuarii]|uniref:LCP family protein n=1 Tax=Clostridium aestuarii TaxID=338193 RepID=A0ABT4CZ72_9CLOT|nr:LCP family protein [Clostridium aestuarii]MCY6484275.1 LCP family protein [Clostridium aestuarii]
MSKKRKKNLFKSSIIVLIFAICLMLLSEKYLHKGLNSNPEVVNDEIDNVIDDTYDDKYKNDKSINILALGEDIGTPGVKDKNNPKRTDTMMLVHYNDVQKKVNIVSIPRDTLIRINRKNAKINAANAVGGAECAVDAVEKLLSLDVDYYVKLNYEGFRKIVDCIGGIDVKIQNVMNYDDDTQDLHIHFKKGTIVHLDGEKAEQFFRWRKNNNGTGLAEGDLGRIQNQHIFIDKVVEKVKSPKIIPRIPAILMILPKYCQTNMSIDDIMKYGYNCISANQISMYSLKGETEYLEEISYFIYEKQYNKKILDEIHDIKVNKEQARMNKNKIVFLNGVNKTRLLTNYRK